MTSYKIILSNIITSNFINLELAKWRDEITKFEENTQHYNNFVKLIEEVRELSVKQKGPNEYEVNLKIFVSNPNYDNEVTISYQCSLYNTSKGILIKNRITQLERILNYLILVRNEKTVGIFENQQVSEVISNLTKLSRKFGFEAIPTRIIFKNVNFNSMEFEELNIKQPTIKQSLIEQLERESENWNAVTLLMRGKDLHISLRVSRYGNFLLYGNSREKDEIMDKFLQELL